MQATMYVVWIISLPHTGIILIQTKLYHYKLAQVSQGVLISWRYLSFKFRVCLLTKGSVHVRGTCICFWTWSVFRRRVVSTSPKPQNGRSHLSGCPRLLIQYIHSYPPYWRPFLHPQPEDAPCRGDRVPLIMVAVCCINLLWFFIPHACVLKIIPNMRIKVNTCKWNVIYIYIYIYIYITQN